MLQEVYIIDDKAEFIGKVKDMFKNDRGIHFVSVKADEMETALKNIPTLIIVEDDNTEMTAVEICQKIRENEDNIITPIIVVSSEKDRDYRLEILNMSIQHYILKPIDDDYFYCTIKNIIELINLNRSMSPLTGLPGNVQIQVEMKRRLLNKESFAVVYYDMDHFKEYNDVYGFSKGDEVIKLLSKIIVRHVHEIEFGNNFTGHVGGDDFVSVISKYDYEELCKNIINDFDESILKYYTAEDVERGYIEVANRRGIIEQFPIVSLSIAVVEVENENFRSTLEIGEVSAQVKHMAKEIAGSSYVINRRRNKNGYVISKWEERC